MSRLPSAPGSASTASRVVKIIAIGLVAFVVGAGGTLAVLLVMKPRDGQSRWHSATQRLAETAVSPNLVFDTKTSLNILMIGEDLEIDNHQRVLKANGRSDTNIMIHLDRVTNLVSVVSIPRDTKARIPGQKPGHEIHKINAAHSLGGPQLVMDTVRANFGVPIDHYVTTNFHGFIKLVDLVGGVDVEVERDMDYDDNWQDFHVHLKKGFQHLNGRQAQGYVRWRKGNKPGTGDPKGDIGRTERQQKVIKLIAAKVLTPAYIPKMPQIARTMLQYIKTDLSTMQLLSLVVFMRGVNAQGITNATLPGDYISPYLYLRKPEAATILRNAFGLEFDETALAGLPGTADRRTDAVRLPDKAGKAQPAPELDSTPPDEDPGDDRPVKHSKGGNHTKTVEPTEPAPTEGEEPAPKPDKPGKTTKGADDTEPAPKLEKVKPDRTDKDDKPAKTARPVHPIDRGGPN